MHDGGKAKRSEAITSDITPIELTALGAEYAGQSYCRSLNNPILNNEQYWLGGEQTKDGVYLTISP